MKEDSVKRKSEMEIIKEIKEISKNGYDGYLIITNEQEIELSIDNSQSCCERWGYFMSEDNFDDYINSQLLDIKLTDTFLNETKMKENDVESLSEGGIMFVDIKTNEGVLQFVAYNEHNGWYGHEAKITSTYIDHNETL